VRPPSTLRLVSLMTIRRLVLVFLVACGHSPPSVGDDTPDAAGDDGSPDSAMPGLCGGETCRADQSCVGDSCMFACSGSQVPGDYATVDAAALALRDVSSAVICLGPASYPVQNLILARDLTIIGVSAGKTTLAATEITTRGHVTFKGVALDARLYMDGFDSTTTLVGAKVTGGIEIQRTLFTPGPAGHKGVLDGVDVAGGIVLRDSICSQCSGIVELDVRNSYIHGGAACMQIQQGGNLTSFVATVINNTIVGCNLGFDVTIQQLPSGNGNLTIDLRNNIFAHHANTAVTTPPLGTISTASSITTGNNALWANTTNYGDGAVDGPGYVKQDCALGTETPPSLGLGSPCRGAADAAIAPDHDYFGHPRTAPVDIGAVEH
jgi:hypothetical protein